MPRNSSGAMSLVAGNPVVTDTPVSSTWANDTLNDIAAEIQDSLSRSGKGGMLVPMEFSDGTAADPAITFSAAPTTGLYRAGTNDVRFSLAGSDLVQFAATVIKFIARVTDGATAVGLTIDTVNALTTSGAKLLSVLNHAVEKFYVDKDGSSHGDLFQALSAVGATLKGNVADGATAVGVILDNANSLANAGAKTVSVRSNGSEKLAIGEDGALIGPVADGASAVGIVLDTTNSLTTSGAKCLSVRNAGTEKASIDKDGRLQIAQASNTIEAISISNSGDGVVLKVVGSALYDGAIHAESDDADGYAIKASHSGSQYAIYSDNGVAGLQPASSALPAVLGQVGATPGRGALSLTPQAAPSAPQNGDIWVEGSSLKVRLGGTTRTVTVT